MPNHIKLVGIELEGAFREQVQGFHHDGSVNVECNCREAPNTHYCHIGEVASPPIPLESIEDWVNVNYPMHCNSSCGLHVHLSFLNNSTYGRLTWPDFHEFFLNSWDKWGHEHIPDDKVFWSRYRGESQYCLMDFKPEDQWRSASKSNSRYRQLNYCFNTEGSDYTSPPPVIPNRCTCCAIRGNISSSPDYCRDNCPNMLCNPNCNPRIASSCPRNSGSRHSCTGCHSWWILFCQERERQDPPKRRETLECRLLPMFQKKEIAVKAIWHLVSMINLFLDVCDAPKLEEQLEFDLLPDDIVQEVDLDEPPAAPPVFLNDNIFYGYRSAETRTF